MEKFGMSFGGGPSRKELLDTIESQTKQLVQYQTRFKDVVRAYKSLLKEKEALEASLKILTVTQYVDLDQQGLPSYGGAELPEDGASLNSGDSVDTTASVEPPAETAKADQSDEDQGCVGPTSRSMGLPSSGGAELPEDGSSLNSGVSVDTTASVEPPAETAKADQSDEDQGCVGPTSRSMLLQSESEAEGSGVEAEHQQPMAPPSAEAERRIAQLKSQLSTLTGALATVTQEKSRMEASFQADKRQLKQELEDLQEHLVAVTTQKDAELRMTQHQLAESRARVITQQHEREQEQIHHAQQLQELQRILQQERQDADLRLQAAAADRGAESELHLSLAREQRDELRRRLQAAEEDRQRSDPRLEEVQRELLELKNQFHNQIQMETRKACEAEERARERAQAAENRVADLEQRVSELSDLLGSCEKARQRDQQVAQRLRDRILQLDLENKSLAAAAASRRTSGGLDESQLDVGVLKERLQNIKKLLLLAAQKNPDQNLLDPTDTELDQDKVLVYQQELRQVREEFERYKVRAQVVLKNKNAKDGSQAKELEEVRDQLGELREKYITLRLQSDQAEERHRHQLDEQQQQAAALQHANRQEAERAAALHRDELLRLEAELHKQRERTMALLEEKDRDLQRLRAAIPVGDRQEPADAAQDDPADADGVGQALRRVAPPESTLLLYAEQLARKEVEAGALRRHKHRLEDDLHQLQAKLLANAERHDEEQAELQARLDKMVRDQNREGANMEYLKNIVYRFLTLQDASGRRQTLGAILTILHFSPQEKQHVLRQQGATWWGPGPR